MLEHFQILLVLIQGLEVTMVRFEPFEMWPPLLAELDTVIQLHLFFKLLEFTWRTFDQVSSSEQSFIKDSKMFVFVIISYN